MSENLEMKVIDTKENMQEQIVINYLRSEERRVGKECGS